MKLKYLLDGVSELHESFFGKERLLQQDISAICTDTRNIKNNSLFVAIAGLNFDAHNAIPEVLNKGAKAVVGDRDLNLDYKIPYIKVSNSREALSAVAANFYGNPAKKLKMIGITGTDGKTTTANMTFSVLKSAGKKVGVISTLGVKMCDRTLDTGFHVTNPEPLELQSYLRKMVDEGCEYCVLEVTSHGIDQRRIGGINFDVSVITNVTRDHLDYHKTFKNYLFTKAKLFENSKVKIANEECASYKKLKELFGDLICFRTDVGWMDDASLKHMERFFPGRYNLANANAARAVCRALGVTDEQINIGIKALKKVTGRYDVIDVGAKQVIIDFAHTPNALLSLLSEIRKKYESITLVFGCAGERDAGKRPLMGKIASKYCKNIILTSEDPRSEDPLEIIRQIKGGISGKARVFEISDRKEAIEFAVAKKLNESDVVLITGKGHERSMNIRGVEYPWSDGGVVKSVLDL